MAPHIIVVTTALAIAILTGCQPQLNNNNEQQSNNRNTQLSLSEQKQSIRIYAFCAPSIPICKKLEPVLNQFDQKYPDHRIIRINADQDPQLTMKYSIVNIPTILVVKEDEVIHRVLPSLLSLDELSKEIEPHLNK